MRTVVCIGGGRIGAQAALEAARDGARVLVVDRDERCLAQRSAASTVEDPKAILGTAAGDILFLKGDGIVVLLDILDRWTPEMVVPAASGHLAALLAMEHCRRLEMGFAPAPDRLPFLVERLPRGSVRYSDAMNGVVVTSYMSGHGLCLEGCQQPASCPVTAETNPTPMYECIRRSLTSAVDRPVVLATSSIGNVGGIPGVELRSMLRELDGSESGMTWGIATACRCHGITNLLRALSE